VNLELFRRILDNANNEHLFLRNYTKSYKYSGKEMIFSVSVPQKHDIIDKCIYSCKLSSPPSHDCCRHHHHRVHIIVVVPTALSLLYSHGVVVVVVGAAVNVVVIAVAK
jgi:hypothetical protein